MKTMKRLAPPFVMTASLVACASSPPVTAETTPTATSTPTATPTPTPTATPTATSTSTPTPSPTDTGPTMNPPPPSETNQPPTNPPPVIHWNPPPQRTPPNVADFPKVLNGTDAQGRQVMRSSDDTKVACYVPGRPDMRRPGRPGPPTPVACPAGMEKDGWKLCANGTIRANAAGDACGCWVNGNPPPPPRVVSCP